MYTRAGLGQSNLVRDDFMTDRLVIVYYPLGAGGKFLINCLGLSNQCVLQSIELANNQINNQFTSIEKFQFLKSQLQQVDGLWNDISLGCRELFGLDQTVRNSEWWKPELSHYQPYHSDLKSVLDSGKTFFATAHHSRGLEWLLKLWPNARVINCVEGKEYTNTLRKNHPAKPEFASIDTRKKYWNQIRRPHWPLDPPEWQHCLYLAPFDSIQNEISQDQKTKLFNYTPDQDYFTAWSTLNEQHTIEIFNSVHQLFQWNTDFYLSPAQFLQQLQLLYHCLELGDFNEKWCADLLDYYIHALKKIENFSKNFFGPQMF